MDSNPSKSGRGRSTSGRVQGVILSPQGWQNFQAAKQQAEIEFPLCHKEGSSIPSTSALPKVSFVKNQKMIGPVFGREQRITTSHFS